MIDLGVVIPGSTIYLPFDSFAAATGAPSAVTNAAVGDIIVFKDGSDVERATTTGFGITASFNSVTGLNLISIDLSSDATGDFFKAGSFYCVGVSPITIDTQTVAFWAGTFRIGYPKAVLNTSIATLSSQTSFTLTAGPAEDDALNGMWAIVHDKASAVQLTWVQILDYTGSTKTVTLAATPAATFTIAAIDNFCVMGLAPLQPTVIGTRLDVSAGGEAGVDWANVGTPGSTVGLSATTVATVTTTTTATNLTNAPTNGDLTATMKTSVTAAAWDADATGHQTQGTFGQAIGDPAADTNTIFKAVVTDATGATVGVDVVDLKTQIGTAGAGLTAADDAVIAALVTVQSDTDNIQTRLPAALVGGKMDASVSAVTAAALADFFDTDSTTTYASAVAGSVVKEIADNAGGGVPPTAAAIADAVWDEDATGHQTGGTFGQAIGDPGADTNTIFKATVTDATGATVGVDVVDLKTQIGTAGAGLTAADDAVIAAIGALNNLSAAQVATALSNYAAAQPVETYAALGAVPTRDEFLFMILQALSDFAITAVSGDPLDGALITTKKLDGAATAMTHHLDNSTTPTSRART